MFYFDAIRTELTWCGSTGREVQNSNKNLVHDRKHLSRKNAGNFPFPSRVVLDRLRNWLNVIGTIGAGPFPINPVGGATASASGRSSVRLKLQGQV
jgi:hypothetical protein